MPKALANRLLHIEILSDFDSWYEWALQHKIDKRILGYLAFDNSRLNVEPDIEELAFPTPRSWEFVSKLLQITEKNSRRNAQSDFRLRRCLNCTGI